MGERDETGDRLDLQPTLSGRLLTLRPLRADDYDELRAAAADPEIWAQHPVKERATPDGFRAFFDDAMASGGALVALDARSGEVVGTSRYRHHADTGEVEIGWTFLVRSRWGGEWNGEMKAMMLAHAFRFVDRVILIVAPENVRSRRAVEKIGGVEHGTRPDSRGRPSVCYVVTREGWSRRSAAGASDAGGESGLPPNGGSKRPPGGGPNLTPS